MDAFRAGAALDARVALTQAPEESIVICTPFAKPGHFYYNQKINCMRASGTVALGKRVYRFDPSNSFGTLDWGRGVWTYHNTWYWRPHRRRALRLQYRVWLWGHLRRP